MSKNGKQKNGNGKAEKSSAPLQIVQAHGGSLQVGNPGNKGGGRPPNWLKELKRDAAGEATRQLWQALQRQELDTDQLIKVGKDFDPDDKESAVKHDITIRVVNG